MNTPAFLALAALTATSFAQTGSAYEKAAGIRYPKIDLAEASLEDAVAFLRKASAPLAPDKVSFNLVIQPGKSAPKPITLHLANIPAPEAVRYCAEAAGYNVRWSGGFAVISDQNPPVLPDVAFLAGGVGFAKKMSGVVFPRLDFRASTTREALEFVAKKARELAPAGPILNIVVQSPIAAKAAISAKPIPGLEGAVIIAGLDPAPAAPAPSATQSPEIGERELTLTVNNTPVPELLRIIAFLTGTTVRWDSNAVVLGDKGSEKRPEVVNTVAIKGRLIMEKLGSIEIPKLEFREAKMSECAAFLSKKLKELDPDGKGFNLLVSGASSDQMLTFKLDKIPALEALRYMAELSGTDLRIEHNALVFQAK